MFLQERFRKLLCLAVVALLAFSSYAQHKNSKEKKSKTEGTPILWQEPTDIASRDLFLGSGGEAMKPDLSKVTFIEEETGGYSKKYRVRDGAGHEWVAKLGKESQSETAATRLLWAVGYFTEICYLVPKAHIEGKGDFENVKFEARPEHVKRLGIWKWDSNPFIGTNEFQGLKVMMVLLENWDIKDDNNKILRVKNEQTGEHELRYIISDLGGTLGKTGGVFSRSRNKPEDFVKAKFITGVKNNTVEFRYSGKRTELFKDITVEQARWIGNWLSKLSDRQISDAFRAANYSQEEIQMLTEAVKNRIAELTSLPQKQ
ncbi:MAG TPA: hypothetical protein VNN73_13120 [Blastocatellia bacterium]|nr:hypothetical protein [Blastocatellia bacterium]